MFCRVASAVVVGWCLVTMAHAENNYISARDAMVSVVENDVVNTSSYTGIEALDTSVRNALSSVPRHLFVPERLRSSGYENRPLPIGEGQTISQPYIVAMMTQLADVDEQERVLEIGTGSGYQAAVLAEIAKHVYTIEIIDTLAERAAITLESLGYDNVSVRAGDGYLGWPEHAPFDAIIVTAAPETVPEPLIEQLAVGGRLVIPVGPEGRTQSLTVLQKDDSGNVSTRDVLPVRFVPFTRD